MLPLLTGLSDAMADTQTFLRRRGGRGHLMRRSVALLPREVVREGSVDGCRRDAVVIVGPGACNMQHGIGSVVRDEGEVNALRQGAQPALSLDRLESLPLAVCGGQGVGQLSEG